MRKQLLIAFRMLLAMTLLTGVLYPLAITGLSKAFFPAESGGSLLRNNGKVIGSRLIGQSFTGPGYFRPRPSAVDYNPMPSGGSNLGPSSDTLKKMIERRKENFITTNHLPVNVRVPVEMLTASASGLDPHISPGAAFLQVDRVARARNFDAGKKLKLIALIHRLKEPPQFYYLGENRINVLLLNLEVDKIR